MREITRQVNGYLFYSALNFGISIGRIFPRSRARRSDEDGIGMAETGAETVSAISGTVVGIPATGAGPVSGAVMLHRRIVGHDLRADPWSLP